MLSETERVKVRELVAGILPMKDQGCINFALCVNKLKIAELEKEIGRLLATEGFKTSSVKLATRTYKRKGPIITIRVENLPEYFHILNAAT